MDRIRGVVQHYAWGDAAAIPRLIGTEPDGRPWAELWLGTHPGGPATTVDGRPLVDTSGELPYLLKVLAAAEPLSIQTHPTAEQARAGFAREDAAGIARDAPDRTYRDPRAKPELICAISTFEALCGFRPFAETMDWFAAEGWSELRERLSEGPAEYLRRALTSGPHDLPANAPEWAQRIAAVHPGDGGVLVALLLNRVVLHPGEAVFLDAGNVHAYLHGVGVEIMGASDNVIRGGLTSKHVDVDELLRVADLSALSDPVVHPDEVAPGCYRYDTPGTPFTLWRWEITAQLAHVAEGRELLLCTAGDAGLIAAGESAYVGPEETVHLDGPATVFRVEESATGG